MRPFITIALLSFLLLSGCGYKSGVTTTEQRAYLYFTGNTQNVSVTINDGEAFTVLPGRDNQYAIAPGKHRVRIYRGGELIVEREIYVSDGVAKEIGVN